MLQKLWMEYHLEVKFYKDDLCIGSWIAIFKAI